MTPGIVCAKITMSEPASTALMTVGVAMGEIATLPATNAREAMPEPFTTTTSASRPYFSKIFASLVKKMMMLPMLMAGTPTWIFFKDRLWEKTHEGETEKSDQQQ